MPSLCLGSGRADSCIGGFRKIGFRRLGQAEGEPAVNSAKAKIAAMNVAVDDSTDLDKLKRMVTGLKQLDKSAVISAAVPAATITSGVYDQLNAVNALSAAVQAFARGAGGTATS